MQSRTVGKADVGRRCEQVGQTGRPKPAKSAKARFPAAGRFLPDAGPRPAPPDLLPIFALRDLDSKSAPGSASDAAVIPRTTSLIAQINYSTTTLHTTNHDIGIFRESRMKTFQCDQPILWAEHPDTPGNTSTFSPLTHNVCSHNIVFDQVWKVVGKS